MNALSKAFPELLEVPGVGISQHDLHFAASMIAAGFGCSKPESAIAVIAGAAGQATTELRYIAAQLDREDTFGDVCVLLLNICNRLGAAAETADILMKLYTLPQAGQPIAREAAE